MIPGKYLHPISFFFRSFALFLILYQFRLIAGDLADTPVFIATILMAFFTAFIIKKGIPNRKAPGSIAALVIIGLIPWIARLLIALPGIIFRPAATASITITLDSLLLNLDRNNFVSLLPFYWAALSSWFSLRSRKFLRAAIIADAALLLVMYCITRAADIALYRWPIVMIIVFAGIVFMQALALLFSLPQNINVQTGEIIGAVGALIILTFLGGFFFLGPSQQSALEKGGGLLEPKLFSFDFSKFLKLDSEISMSDDLVMIVKKEGDDDHILLRRSVLSGYSGKQGFYRLEDLDEQTHPLRLPPQPMELITQQSSGKAASRIRQEYFLVNFDAAAFIGMNQPVSVTPYENWDASSFRSAFMVDSIVCNAPLADLYRVTQNWPGAEELGLSADEFKIYTNYGDDERLRNYAQEITQNFNLYSQKIMMIHNHLKYGEYRYSLKPGIAPDGDQLGWFLFNSKKGYCSYYAFAMTLMLRSLGIPARVAAGFFIDPETNTFDYYPVRSDMAHAWVEVLYPDYGWIEFDPTTEYLAAGEEFRFSTGVDPNLFEKLMREILENRWLLRTKEGRELTSASPASSFMRSTAALFKKYWFIPLLIVLIALNIYIRCKYFIASALYTDKRKKAVRLWKHCRRRLRLAGIKPKTDAHESEWAQNTNALIPGIYSLYQCAAAARFAPAYTADDFTVMQNQYMEFSAKYRQAVFPLRRIIAWILPFLALLLPVRGKTGGVTGKSLILPVITALFLLGSSDIKAQISPDALSDADILYENAMSAIDAEHWERAIDTLKTGEKLFPADIRFPWVLGNLYYARSLYGLAWDEYKKAETIYNYDEDIILMLAHTAGLLNRYHTSIDYYQKALLLNPENKDVISDLAWMFYKVYRLNDGEKLLTDAIDHFGERADYAMTLGTIYSVMYEYDKSKYWYQKAISLGREMGDTNFTAVAHYNLSILESRFYRYDLSMNETNASLNSRTRASGLLARGELNMRRLELRQSQSDFQAAYELDTSPLAKLGLAQIYQISGRLEEARLYAEDCLKAKDHSWMLNYGIDPGRYKRDIHEILGDTYEGLANTEKLTPWGKPKEKLRSFYRKISYRYKTKVHRRLYEKYSLATADSFRAELSSDSPLIDTIFQYYNAFQRYPYRADIYFNFTRDLEISIIPASGPSYDTEEGIYHKNTALLEHALAGLDPNWEQLLFSRCYQEIARSPRKILPLRGNTGLFGPQTQQAAKRQLAAEELFSLNRGGLRQAGIRLPVEIDLHLIDEHNSGIIPGIRRDKKYLFKYLHKTLKRTGFDIINTAPDLRYKLQLTIDGSPQRGYSVLCELIDTNGVGQIFMKSFPLRNFSQSALCDFGRSLGNTIFTVE